MKFSVSFLAILGLIAVKWLAPPLLAFQWAATLLTALFVFINLKLLFKYYQQKKSVSETLDSFMTHKGGSGLATYMKREALVFKSIGSMLGFTKVSSTEVDGRFGSSLADKSELFLALLIILPVEAACVHLVIEQAMDSTKWIHIGLLALEIYGLAWALGCYRLSKIA